MAVYASQLISLGGTFGDSIGGAMGGSAVSADMNIIDLEINFLCFWVCSGTVCWCYSNGSVYKSMGCWGE